MCANQQVVAADSPPISHSHARCKALTFFWKSTIECSVNGPYLIKELKRAAAVRYQPVRGSPCGTLPRCVRSINPVSGWLRILTLRNRSFVEILQPTLRLLALDLQVFVRLYF